MFVRPGQLLNDPKQARDIVLNILDRAMGDEARDPTHFHDHDRGPADPWRPSCIPALPPGFLTKRGKFLQPPVGGLFWAGTETADIWAISMDGAVRSGHQAVLLALHSLAHR